jgi:hypothetical protein
MVIGLDEGHAAILAGYLPGYGPLLSLVARCWYTPLCGTDECALASVGRFQWAQTTGWRPPA